MVVKIDEVYVLSIVKIYQFYFICFLCCAKEGRDVENIESNSFFENA